MPLTRHLPCMMHGGKNILFSTKRAQRLAPISLVAEDTQHRLIQKYASEPQQAALHGNIEDVFLALTGHKLRD